MQGGRITKIIIIFCTSLIILVNLNSIKAETFSEPIKVNDTTGTVSEYTILSSCIDNENTIHVVWADRSDSLKIRYSRSRDYGLSFKKSFCVFDMGNLQSWPSIASDGSCNLHIAWETDNKIYYSKLIKGEDEFGSPKIVSDRAADSCSHPNIAVDGNDNIHIAWTDYRNGATSTENSDIYYTHSNDGGSTFSADIRVDDDEGYHRQLAPIMAIDSMNNIHMVWMDDRAEIGDYYYSFNIHYSISTDGGSTFESSYQINEYIDEEVLRTVGEIAIDSNDNIHVTYEDDREGGAGVYYLRSVDGGDSFTDEIMVSKYTDTVGVPTYSNIVAHDGSIIIGWVDDRYKDPRWRDDIYYSRSDDGGNTFCNQICLTKDHDFITCGGLSLNIDDWGYLYAVWFQEDEDENIDVYFSTTVSNIDSDEDGVIDDRDPLPHDDTQWEDQDGDGYGDNPNGNDPDIFPSDKTQWKDEDGDGYGDNPLGYNPDKFPSDPTEWNDTDGDGFGDNIDYYPNDPSKYKKEEDTEDLNWVAVIGIVIIIVIVIVIVMFLMIRKKRSRQKVERSVYQFDQGEQLIQNSQFPQEDYRPQTMQPQMYPHQQYRQPGYPLPPPPSQQSYPQRGYPAQQYQQQEFPYQNYPKRERIRRY
jgi:hypothetical protein